MFARRRIIQQRQPIQNANKSSSFVSFKVLIVLFVIILCSFSLYQSTQILQSQNDHNDAIRIDLNNDDDDDDDDEDESEQQSILSNDDDGKELRISQQKSLKMYLLREGHMDRVEYMIGFTDERILNNNQYWKLLPRDMNKMFDRDYINSQPVSISGWQPQPDSEHKCDANCIAKCSANCDVNGIKWSMENIEMSQSSNIITGSTRLDSLIPVPYFSWYDFGFLTPFNNNKRMVLAAAFISNCGFPKRNKMVVDLQRYGVSIDSYGRCEHNKDEDRTNGNGREQTKISLLSTYKFSLAFENSESDDYISEKFFGTLVSGSIPVYIGAPNIKFFAPDAGNINIGGPGKPWKSHSVIWAGDFDFDAKKLAKYLLYLNGNDTAYNEYIQWKIDGFSGDFKALIELTSGTHTNCRQCIIATDWQRYKYGITKYDQPIATFDYKLKLLNNDQDNDDNKWFYIRERGMYRFALIRIEKNTLASLVKNILQSIKPKPVNKWKNNDHPQYNRIGPALYAIYHVPTKHVINSDQAIQNLQNYVELEIIFV